MAKVKVINISDVAYDFPVLTTQYLPSADGKQEVQHRVQKNIVINGKRNKMIGDSRLIVFNNEAITELEQADWQYILDKYSHSEPIRQKMLYVDSKNLEGNLQAYAVDMKDAPKPCAPLDIEKIGKASKGKVKDLTKGFSEN